MKIYQQTKDCSDFDITIGKEGKPSFRVLLPEWIKADGIKFEGLYHTISGKWRHQGNHVEGSYDVADQLRVDIGIRSRHTDILVDLSLTNIGGNEISKVWADVCTSINHLPGEPSWSNKEFMGNLPLDRAIQGRFWYEQLAPRHLFAITTENWVNMHPNSDDPNADLVPLYNFAPSEKAEAIGCAVESLDGNIFCFQAWSNLSRYCTPSPGNACMHLQPFVTESLSPDETAKIRGLIGIHFGNRIDLKTKIIGILGRASS